MKKLSEDRTFGEEHSLGEEQSLDGKAFFWRETSTNSLAFRVLFIYFDLGLLKFGNQKGILGIK